MKKTMICLLLMAAMLMNISCIAESGMTPGVYQATARGHNADVVLDVQLSESKIEAITVVGHGETSIVSDAAFAEYIPAIIENQSTDIDCASGATFTKRAIRLAVEEAVKAAGGDPSQFSVKVEAAAAEEKQENYDVIVVGSGIAGLSAAIEAREEGASVIVLEKLSHIGGNSLINGGYVYGAGSKHQAALGAETGTAQELADYWMQIAEGKANEAQVKFVAERSGETIDWFVDFLGIDLPNVTVAGQSALPRSLVTADWTGYGIVKPLYDKCVELGVEFALNTKAEELIVSEKGKVVGVKAACSKNPVIYNGGSVVLATGGYDQSRDMKALYSSKIANEFSYSSPGNTGDGIVMAQEIGAATNFDGGYIGYRMVPGMNYADTTSIVWTNGMMFNGEGKRFVGEDMDYPLMHEVMAEEGSSMFYHMIDADNSYDVWEYAVEMGQCYKADTIEELANQIGISPDTLQATVSRYNELCEKGVDEDFGKAYGMETLSTAPFYAAKVMNCTIGSIGGICTDTDAKVLSQSGEAIEGLYAAGACANGDFLGTLYPASGSSVIMCAVFGREAGMNAAQAAK